MNEIEGIMRINHNYGSCPSKWIIKFGNKLGRELYRKIQKWKCRQKYVRNGELYKIKNFHLAKSDDFIGWEIHHINEETFTMNQLIKMNMYYDRPPEELIFVKEHEHKEIHKRIFYKMRELGYVRRNGSRL